ncbi:MAG: penicillin-binding protein 2 [Bryobacteraceae bacterium]
MARIPEDREHEAPIVSHLVRDDANFGAVQVAIFQYLTVAVFIFLLAGYWDLQVRNESLYNTKALQNQIKSLPMPAPRGRILDRDGRVIVDNHASYRLVLSRENLREEHIVPIAQGLDLDVDDLETLVRRYDKRPSYYTIPVKEELTPAELAFVEAHRNAQMFPEMELIKSQFRLYPQGGFASHLIGYVGEISDAELNSPEWANHNPGDLIGKMGVERNNNEILTGIDGQRQVVVDNRMNTRQVLGVKPAVPGKDLRLTIDLDLQTVAELAMEGRRGAVVALVPATGEVLALVSTPGYDPNHFVGRINSREWKALTEDPNKPLFNRALQSQLAPGSTFKPIVALAALETGAIDENFEIHCAGGADFFGRYFKCHKKGGHGAVTLHKGITQSCDVYFYNVGLKTGIDNIAKYAEMVGYGRKTGIDLPGEKEGVVPSTAWKIRTFREKWYEGETVSVAIGQGATTITPLQLAYAFSGLVNKGVWMRPHLVEDGRRPQVDHTAAISPLNLGKVLDGMCGVVNEGGTGASARLPDIMLCGKTGSSQRASNDFLKTRKGEEEFKDDAWFVGFASRDNPEIVVAALFENGVHGNFAAPIVRDVIKAYYDKQRRQRQTGPLPSLSAALSLAGTAPATLAGAKVR